MKIREKIRFFPENRIQYLRILDIPKDLIRLKTRDFERNSLKICLILRKSGKKSGFYSGKPDLVSQNTFLYIKTRFYK